MVKVILRSLVFLNPTQVQLIRGDPRYKLMCPEEVIGKFVSFELMIKGSKKIIEQGASSSVPEAQPVAFKATEEKKEDSTPSRVLKGKCALGPFLSILVIECQHKCLSVKLCQGLKKCKSRLKVCF
jgi:hypothetical protein